MKKIISLTIALVLAALTLAACGVDYTEAEIKKVARTLIEKSYDVNEIFFGRGLPVDEDYDDLENYLQGAADIDAEDLDVAAVQYVGVDPDSGYDSDADLKAAAEAVYTKEYCEDVFVPAFEGVTDEDTGTLRYARFMVNVYDTLCERKDIVEEGPELLRTYDLDTIEVQEMKAGRCKITVDAVLGDGKTRAVRLFLVKEERGWRLDTPTYIVADAMESYNPDLVTTNADRAD